MRNPEIRLSSSTPRLLRDEFLASGALHQMTTGKVRNDTVDQGVVRRGIRETSILYMALLPLNLYSNHCPYNVHAHAIQIGER